MKIIEKFIHKIKNDFHLGELFKGGSVSFLLKSVGLIIGYIFSIVVTRTLGAESWGIYSLCLAIITIAGIFAKLGFDTTILRLNAEYKSTGKENSLLPLSKLIFKISTSISIFIAIVVYLFSDFIALNIFSKPNLADSVRLVSFAIPPFALSTISSSALRGFKKIPKAVFIEHVAKFTFMLFALIMGFTFFQLQKESIVVIIVIASYLMFIQSIFWYLKEIRTYKFSFLKEIKWRPIIKIALPLILASSALYLKGWIDTISIGIFMDEKDVGIYNITQKLANLSIIPLVAINAIASPKYAESKIDKKELKAIFRKNLKLVFIFSTPILIGLILFSNPLLKVFGPDFESAKFILIIISFAAFINAIFGSFGYLLQMTGYQIVFQNSIIVFCILSFGLNYYLIPIYGLTGAAISTILVNLVWNLILVVYVSKKLGIWTLK